MGGDMEDFEDDEDEDEDLSDDDRDEDDDESDDEVSRFRSLAVSGKLTRAQNDGTKPKQEAAECKQS
jgi:nucleosome assembly protein 1-like 1